MTKETTLWHYLRSRLEAEGLFCQRIETSTSDGVPDVFVCQGTTWFCWVELKVTAAIPACASTPVFGARGLRPAQVAWFARATAARVPCAVLAGVGHGSARVCFLVPGRLACLFNRMSAVELEPYKLDLKKSCIGATLSQLYRRNKND